MTAPQSPHPPGSPSAKSKEPARPDARLRTTAGHKLHRPAAITHGGAKNPADAADLPQSPPSPADSKATYKPTAAFAALLPIRADPNRSRNDRRATDEQSRSPSHSPSP